MKSSRRTFILSGAGLASALVLAKPVFAQAAVVSESDANAAPLGYKADATKVDKSKYPTYAAGQVCANCLLYQGKATDATGPCQVFAPKLVSSKGWCLSYTKKA